MRPKRARPIWGFSVTSGGVGFAYSYRRAVRVLIGCRARRFAVWLRVSLEHGSYSRRDVPELRFPVSLAESGRLGSPTSARRELDVVLFDLPVALIGASGDCLLHLGPARDDDRSTFPAHGLMSLPHGSFFYMVSLLLAAFPLPITTSTSSKMSQFADAALRDSRAAPRESREVAVSVF